MRSRTRPSENTNKERAWGDEANNLAVVKQIINLFERSKELIPSLDTRSSDLCIPMEGLVRDDHMG